MKYQNDEIAEVAKLLKSRLEKLDDKRAILRAPEFKALYAEIGKLPAEDKASFGQEVNKLRAELEELVAGQQDEQQQLEAIDVSAPFDVNVASDKRPHLLSADIGSKHPLTTELDRVLDIFGRMGFIVMESRQLDDDYHMFESLNFPEGHPARGDYDTFTTIEKDKDGKPFIAPAHASVMQNRILRKYGKDLEKDKPIGVVYAGRTFRNEDIDARHEHTFNQVEIMYVGKTIHAGNLVATFKTFLESYYEQEIEVRTQPFYFPFTEPSFELALSCPFCQKKGCNVCSYTGWIELLGMGLVHPNVLKMGGVDPSIYTGFAGGMGLDRLVMMKHNIEDIRNFNSGKLEFLRQFK